MVVPFRHVKDVSRMKDAENAEMMRLAAVAVKALEKTMFPQGHNLGINLGAAGGAGIRGHLHLHVVPRWVGDTNWMPILAQTKVMIEYVGQTFDRLAPVIRQMAKKKKNK
jgi:ATP adenylyltransferase